MSTPHYIILSDSEDEYPSTPTVEPSDFHSDMDMDITSHFPPTSDDEIVTHHTPTADESMETEPFEEEEEEPSEEDPSEEEIETSSTHTPVVTLPTPIPPPPPYYMMHGSCSRATARKSVRLPRQELAEPIDDTFYTDIHVVTPTPPPPTPPPPPPYYMTHGPCTRATARKSVRLPRQELAEPIGDTFYTDIHVVTPTPTPTTPIPTPTTSATAPIFTTPTAATTTSAPQQDHSTRYREWMHSTLQTWRQVEGLPSTFEFGESSTTPALASVTPILVAQLARQEREQRALEQDFGRYTSQNNANIRRSFAAANDDGMMTDRAVASMRTRLSDAEVDIAVLRSRVEMAERHAAEAMRRIAELEETLRRQSGTDRASTSQRPGHP